MTRDGWREVPLEPALKRFMTRGAGMTGITISDFQVPTPLHREAYRLGYLVIELDEDEQPVHAYQREEAAG